MHITIDIAKRFAYNVVVEVELWKQQYKKVYQQRILLLLQKG